MDNQLVETNKHDDKISSSLVGYSPEQVAIIKNTVAKGTTNIELAYFLQVAQTIGLSPFNKEIWCYKDTKGNLLVFAGRDGFLKKAQDNPNFAGIRSCEIRATDKFSIDVANKKIFHEVEKWGDERGPIKGAYAIVFRKDGEPTIEIADFARYNKKFFVWKSHPEAMIKKVAETNALKKAFGITGVQSEYDFDVKKEIAVPLEASVNFPMIDSINDLREGSEGVTNEVFLENVCLSELGKSSFNTEGEKEHIRKVIFDDNAFDLNTGVKIDA